MSEMIKNPRFMRKAEAEVREVLDRKGKADEAVIHEMKFLKLVIKGTSRLHPLGPLLIPRESRKRCEINGFNVPIKTKVIVNAWAIGRDPNCWAEPKRFDLKRFFGRSVDFEGTNFEYIPFGDGRRIFLGISYGLVNVELFLAMFLYHFDWKLPNGIKKEELDMLESLGLTARRIDDQLLIPTSYHPSPIA